ncbi:hypothetical protein QTP88_028688 [Uroleucon formosanum]
MNSLVLPVTELVLSKIKQISRNKMYYTVWYTIVIVASTNSVSLFSYVKIIVFDNSYITIWHDYIIFCLSHPSQISDRPTHSYHSTYLCIKVSTKTKATGGALLYPRYSTTVLTHDFSVWDPYVKVWLHVGDKKVEKRKSIVFKCNLNPIFDEKFEYQLPVEQLREAALEVMVMDFDNIGRNELIGKITISSNKNATGQLEAQHWKDMLSKPKQSVEYWHRLKPE